MGTQVTLRRGNKRNRIEGRRKRGKKKRRVAGGGSSLLRELSSEERGGKGGWKGPSAIGVVLYKEGGKDTSRYWLWGLSLYVWVGLVLHHNWNDYAIQWLPITLTYSEYLQLFGWFECLQPSQLVWPSADLQMSSKPQLLVCGYFSSGLTFLTPCQSFCQI